MVFFRQLISPHFSTPSCLQQKLLNFAASFAGGTCTQKDVASGRMPRDDAHTFRMSFQNHHWFGQRHCEATLWDLPYLKRTNSAIQGHRITMKLTCVSFSPINTAPQAQPSLLPNSIQHQWKFILENPLLLLIPCIVLSTYYYYYTKPKNSISHFKSKGKNLP